MPIDDKTVDKIAELARLRFSPEDKIRIKDDLGKIINFIDKLNEVDTSGVEPLIYMNEGEDDLREDVVSYQISQQDALKNAPQKDSDYIKVPTVLKRKN